MILLVSLILSIIYGLLTPISEGLLDTSNFVAKVLAPVQPGEKDLPVTRQMLKISQASLMEGWLSNIPFLNTILFLTTIVLGFFYSWWGGILMIFVSVIFGMIAKYFLSRPLSYYLVLIHHKMLQRSADYRMKNDLSRYEASESVNKDLEKLIGVYSVAAIKPPTEKQLKDVPYGDIYYWFKLNDPTIVYN
jgi:hypothetical protein